MLSVRSSCTLLTRRHPHLLLEPTKTGPVPRLFHTWEFLMPSVSRFPLMRKPPPRALIPKPYTFEPKALFPEPYMPCVSPQAIWEPNYKMPYIIQCKLRSFHSSFHVHLCSHDFGLNYNNTTPPKPCRAPYKPPHVPALIVGDLGLKPKSYLVI